MKSRLMATVAGGFALFGSVFGGGCAASKSGQVPYSVMDASAASELESAIRIIGPGYASVDSVANDALSGLVADVVSDNKTRNNRYISFLFWTADGTWRKDTVHALTGDHQGSPRMNYQPTERELLMYMAQQPGTDVRLIEDGKGQLLQGFTDIDTILVRNKNAPSNAWVMGVSGWDGSVKSVRPATPDEITESQTRPSYNRIRAPHNITRVRNYDPQGYARDQRRLWRANVEAGNAYPLSSPYEKSTVNQLPEPAKVNPAGRGR